MVTRLLRLLSWQKRESDVGLAEDRTLFYGNGAHAGKLGIELIAFVSYLEVAVLPLSLIVAVISSKI